MEPPMKHEPSAVAINTSEEDVELEDGNAVLVKRRRTEFSGFTDMENKVPDGLPVEVSTGKDPMDVLTDCAVQSSGEVNGCNKGNTSLLDVIGPAMSRLPKLCVVNGWKEPSFDFKEQGPPHNKLFVCKVTVHMEGLVNTVMECFGDPKPKKKAAQEHAAQAALWCLKRFGHTN